MVGNFSYTHVENLSQVYRVNYLYIICYLYMCVGQRGGGYGRITKYAGHIMHYFKCRSMRPGCVRRRMQDSRYSSILQNTRHVSTARNKHSQRLRLQCETGLTCSLEESCITLGITPHTCPWTGCIIMST